MYDFVDRPVTGLDRGARFLIWSMRRWMSAMGERRCPGGVLAGPFVRWNMTAGLHPFLRMMALFNHNGLETFQFCTLACNHVSEHEAIILSLICGLRDQRPEVVRDTLAMLIDENSVGELLVALAALGRAMESAAIHPARSV